MKHTAQDILNYVEDNDVKFVRLAFCDIFGNQKTSLSLPGTFPMPSSRASALTAAPLPGL